VADVSEGYVTQAAAHATYGVCCATARRPDPAGYRGAPGPISAPHRPRVRVVSATGLDVPARPAQVRLRRRSG
jgi:hypothetical protein